LQTRPFGNAPLTTRAIERQDIPAYFLKSIMEREQRGTRSGWR